MIQIPIEIGDTILTGRFKNHKVIVKEISQDENGLPLVNGKGILKIRIEKLMKTKKQIKEDTLSDKQILLAATKLCQFFRVENQRENIIKILRKTQFDSNGVPLTNVSLLSKILHSTSDEGTKNIVKASMKENKKTIKESGRPNIPIDVKIKKEDNRFWIQLKEDDTVVGSPQGYETKEMAEMACNGRGFKLNDDELELPETVEVPEPSKGKPIKFKKPEIIDVGEEKELKESLKNLIKEMLLETRNLPPYSPLKSINSKQTGKRTTSKKELVVEAKNIKIKITGGSKQVILVKDILHDLSIKQPAMGYSDVFVIPKYEFDLVQQQFDRNRIQYEVLNEGKFIDEIKALIREQLKKKKLTENSPELDSEIEEYAKLSDQIDRMKAELEQMEKRFETLDQKFRVLLEGLATELDETSKVYIRTKNILITIKKHGYDRTNKSYKDAYEFIRKKVNPKLQQMMDEVLETSKTISYVKSKLGVQYESKINENWVTNLFNKVKNFFVNGIKKLRSLNQSVNQDLTKLEGML